MTGGTPTTADRFDQCDIEEFASRLIAVAASDPPHAAVPSDD
jgi:hypothetical protein